MTSAARWGTLVVAALPCAPSACSPTPAPAAPAVLAPPLASASAVASAATRLTDLVDLFTSVPELSAPVPGSLSVDVITARFGRGTFTHRTFQGEGNRRRPCPVTRAEGCGIFLLRLDATAPPGDLWPTTEPSRYPPAIASDDKAAKVFASPHEWIAFSGGRDSVYALREGRKVIDRIDDQGQVTLFVEDESMRLWHDFWVIERQGRTFVAGLGETLRQPSGEEDGREPVWLLTEVLDGARGAPRHLGPSTELPMRIMNRFDAHGARNATQDGKMASLRPPQPVALPDEGAEKDRWAMVWLEVVPPSHDWPRGKTQRGISATPMATKRAASSARKGARHECGGPSSRSLDDASVTKRAHVTRFAGTRLLDDQVRWTGASVGDVAAVKLAPRLDGAEVVVATPPRSPTPASKEDDLREPGADNALVKIVHDERVTAFAYDPGAREGIVVMRDNGRTLHRRFDAAGRPIGAAVEVNTQAASSDGMTFSDRDISIEDVALIEGRWMAISTWPRALYNLSDRTGPFALLDAPRRVARLAVVAGGGVIMSVEGQTLTSLPIGPDGVRGPAVALEELPTSFDLDLRTFTTDQTTAVAFFEPRDTPEGSDKIAWRPLTPGAPWTHAELPSKTALGPGQLSLHQLIGDAVVAFNDDDSDGHLTWLKTGKSESREPPSEGEASADEPVLTGPLLGYGLRLPSRPGPPIHEGALVGLGKMCDQSVMTGSNTVVAVCEHPSSVFGPERRVALRTLHIEIRR